MNCETNIADNLDKLTKKLVQDRYTYKFNTKNKSVEIKIGGNSKAQTVFEANIIALNLAKRLNKAANSERFLDNIYIANGNYVERNITSKYINGMLQYDSLKDIDSYLNYMEEHKDEGENVVLAPNDYELSEMLLQEQENREINNKIEELFNNGEVIPFC